MTKDRRRRVALLGLAALLPLSCSEPALPEPAPSTDDAPDVLAAEVPDPARDELVGALEELTATLIAAQDQLTTAADAQDTATTRSAVTAALALLLDERPRADAPSALFPVRTLDRSEAGAQDDLLSVTLAAAREASGPLGRATVETLRDPLAGDLGAWERDAEGVLTAVRATVRGVRSVQAAEPAVLELPADGVRALAWVLLASEANDLAVVRAAAARAASHLEVVLISLSLLSDEPPAGESTEGSTEESTDDA